MQTAHSIEQFYEKPDPWAFQTNPADHYRKGRIIGTLYGFGPFESALDIACGEGWITQDIPAREIFGYELSQKAALRFPSVVKHVTNPIGKFDLVMVTGALYAHYDWEHMVDMINAHAGNIILLSNVAAWEVPGIENLIQAKQIVCSEYDYEPAPGSDFRQRLRVFRV